MSPARFRCAMLLSVRITIEIENMRVGRAVNTRYDLVRTSYPVW